MYSKAKIAGHPIHPMLVGWHGWNLVATHKVGVTLTPEQERLEPVDKMSPREHRIDTRKPQGVV